MLATLARAVEQEDRREELSIKLAEETRTLDVLGAEVRTPQYTRVPYE